MTIQTIIGFIVIAIALCVAIFIIKSIVTSAAKFAILIALLLGGVYVFAPKYFNTAKDVVKSEVDSTMSTVTKVKDAFTVVDKLKEIPNQIDSSKNNTKK